MTINHAVVAANIALVPKNAEHSILRPFLFKAAALIFLMAWSINPTLSQERMIVLNDATGGQPYDYELAHGGMPPYAWRIVQGNLPRGLSLTPAGHLTGSPLVAAVRPEPYRFQVEVTDSGSGAAQLKSTQWISLRIVPAPPPAPSPSLFNSTGVEVPVNYEPVNYVLPTSTSDEETIALTESFPATPPFPSPSEADTSADNISTAKTLIADSIGTSTSNFHRGDYCVLHVIVWKNQNPDDKKAEPSRELWALFRSKLKDKQNVEWIEVKDKQKPDVFSTRIFGKRRVAVLLVSLNTPQSWDIKYKVTINRKIPTPLQNVFTLLSVISGANLLNERNKPKNVWGARMMLIRYLSSELAVKVNTVTTNEGGDGEPVEQSKEYAKTYVNEGKFHWDVSLGLPVKSVKELQFTTDPSNGNRITTAAKERQDVYGFFNFFPKRVDLKGEDFLTWPHLLVGVPMASKPLHRPLVGIGTGVYKSPIKFNLFAGVVFTRERVPGTLNVGDVANNTQLQSDLHTRWVRKFNFGINFPISQIKDAIKSK